MSRLLAIVGPTGSGKSALAMALAQRFNGEIICADSRTVYRYMDIGTAKPTKDEMLLIPHHLVDVVEPGESFSAADFKVRAVEAIDEITGRGKLPILVGGTGLYVDAVLLDYQFPPKGDPAARQELEKMSDSDLLARLVELDPEAYEAVDRANRRRVIRAVETAGQARGKSDGLRPGTLVLGLALNKNELQNRIAARAEKMLGEGLIEEVKSLAERFSWDAPGLSAPAYRAFKNVVLGDKTLVQGLTEFIRRDTDLAKRQMTWFKRNKEIVWLEADDPELAQKAERLVVDRLGSEEHPERDRPED